MHLYRAFAQAVRRFPDRVALEWEEGKKTYGQVFEEANRIGHYLIQHYARPRQNLVLICPNTPNFIPALHGILAADHTIVPLNPLLAPEEMACLIEHSDAPAVLYDPLVAEKMGPLQCVMKKSVRFIALDEMMSSSPETTSHSPVTDPDDLSMILYTSGTTGNPKGVMLSHRNVYSNSECFPSLLHFGPEDTFLCILPLFHTFAMTVIAFGALLSGGKVILYMQFVPQKVLEAIVSEPNVILVAVPPMYHLLARLAPEGIAEQHRLRCAVSGGGPLPMEVGEGFKKKFKHEILEGYGLTEAAPVISLNPLGLNVPGTIGPPVPGVQVEIRNEKGEALPPGEVGELCATGENIMKGYYKNPQETGKAFHADGWLRTGDMALFEEHGHLKIMGRYKDLIVSAGENIYPREIEETLLRYPGVLEAAVVGKPDRLRSEIPQAFVVLADSAKGKVDEHQLRSHCREHLAEFKIPDGFTFVEQLPKTATGKIQKEVIKQRYFSK